MFLKTIPAVLPAVPRNVAQVALVLDLARAPRWLFAKYPDARSQDSHGRSYELLSWSHEVANKAALGFLGDIAGHLAQTHSGCVTAMQPVYNNEYQVGTARVNRIVKWTRGKCMLHACAQLPCRKTAVRLRSCGHLTAPRGSLAASYFLCLTGMIDKTCSATCCLSHACSIFLLLMQTSPQCSRKQPF